MGEGEGESDGAAAGARAGAYKQSWSAPLPLSPLTPSALRQPTHADIVGYALHQRVGDAQRLPGGCAGLRVLGHLAVRNRDPAEQARESTQRQLCALGQSIAVNVQVLGGTRLRARWVVRARQMHAK